MTRRKRLQQVRFWRQFITDVNKQPGLEELKALMIRLSEVRTIQIEYGWTTWVTVTLNNQKKFVDNNVFPLESLRNIAHQIYRYAVNEYLEYINNEKKLSGNR